MNMYMVKATTRYEWWLFCIWNYLSYWKVYLKYKM